ncbi:MAG: ScyD/ScyE family protein [Gaiellaceae bacterium MAG52_C11]|nr:ScyD/ScyE family protein [Candidatus Gaiellasilicea maunaloa]
MLVAGSICAVACATGLTLGGGADAASRVTVLAKNLNSPRGLNFAPEGHLIVVESGNGAAPCAVGAGITVPPRDVPGCVNATGAIVVRSPGSTRFERYHTGWPSWRTSVAGQPSEVTGLHDIGFPGLAKAYVTIGWDATPAARSGGGSARRSFGRLVKTGPDRGKLVIADLAAFEQRRNPAGGPVDSNPYGLLAEARSTFVADAGANALYEVKRNGNVSLVTTFPLTTNPPTCTLPGGEAGPPASDPVPTTVVRGPDKALCVGELTGFPFCAGVARVWRVVPGAKPKVHRTGFKMIIDMAFAKDGTLYVLQFASSPACREGRVRSSGCAGTDNGRCSTPASGSSSRAGSRSGPRTARCT